MIACSLHAHHAAERQSSTIWILEVNYASQKPYIRQEMFWNLFLIVKMKNMKIKLIQHNPSDTSAGHFAVQDKWASDTGCSGWNRTRWRYLKLPGGGPLGKGWEAAHFLKMIQRGNNLKTYRERLWDALQGRRVCIPHKQIKNRKGVNRLLYNDVTPN